MDLQAQRLLISWMAKPQLFDYIQRNCPPETVNMREIGEKWEKASHLSAVLAESEANEADSVEVRPLSGDSGEKIAGLSRRPAFRNSLGGTKVEFGMVQIGRVATFPVAVYLQTVENIAKKIPESPSERDLMEVCFTEEQDYPPIEERAEPGLSRTFTSTNSDFRITDVITREVAGNDVIMGYSSGIPLKVFSIVLGYGLPFATAVRVGRKLFLVNGFHRLLALMSKGVEFAPVLIIDEPQNIASISGLRMEEFMGRSRPPMVKDFNNPGLTLQIGVMPKRKAIRIKIMQEVVEEPLWGDQTPTLSQSPAPSTDYSKLATAIVQKQIGILGSDLALQHARRVPWIAVDGNGRVTGAGKDSLSQLVSAFRGLEGGFSAITAKKAIRQFLIGGEDLPDELK